jgi:hypothetical protein
MYQLLAVKGWIIISDKLGRPWNVAVVAYIKLLSILLHERTERSHKKSTGKDSMQLDV